MAQQSQCVRKITAKSRRDAGDLECLDGNAAGGESRAVCGYKTVKVSFNVDVATHFFLMLGHSLRTSSLQAILNL